MQSKPAHHTATTREPYGKPTISLVVAIGCAVLLTAILATGYIGLRPFLAIRDNAHANREEILSSILGSRQTAIELERLNQLAESVYYLDTPQLRNRFAKEAQEVVANRVFSPDPQINRRIRETATDIQAIATIRDKQTAARKKVASIATRFAPGNANAAILGQTQEGRKILDTLQDIDSIRTITALTALETMIESRNQAFSATPKMQEALSDLNELFSAMQNAVAISDESATRWQQVNAELIHLADNLSYDATINTDKRFATIAQETDGAIRTALTTLVCAILIMAAALLLLYRYIITPIATLARNGAQQSRPDRREPKLREVRDLRDIMIHSQDLAELLEQQSRQLEETARALAKADAKNQTLEREARSTTDKDGKTRLSPSGEPKALDMQIRPRMAALIDATQEMLKTGLSPAQEHQVEKLLQSGKAILTSIDNAIGVSEPERGAITIEPSTIMTSDFVADIQNEFSGRSELKGLEFSTDVDSEVPSSFEADPVRLRQVLANLLDNAIQFTEQGEIRLAIHSTGGDTPQFLTFAVIDTGVGIREDMVMKTVSSSSTDTSSTSEKTGLPPMGLAMSKELLALMNSKLQVESEPSHGTTFYFTLDLNSSTMKAPSAHTPATRRNMHQELADKAARILVVEDSDSNQALIELYFKKTACSIDFAENGQEAVEAFTKNQYDMILMDIQMPVMDGYEATRQIRAHEKANDLQPIPIVAVTANAFTEDQERCLAAGCTDYLPKPISKVKLLECVGRHTANVS